MQFYNAFTTDKFGMKAMKDQLTQKKEGNKTLIEQKDRCFTLEVTK